VDEKGSQHKPTTLFIPLGLTQAKRDRVQGGPPLQQIRGRRNGEGSGGKAAKPVA